MERRKYVTIMAVLGATGLAGCLSDDRNSPDNENESNSGTDSDTTDGSDGGRETDIVETVDAYLEAAAAEDTDTLADIVHSSSPLHPDSWEEDGWEFQGDEYEDITEHDAEIVTKDGSIDQIRELENAEVWFQEVDLEEEIGSKDIALADVTVEGLDWEGPERWVFVTEDDEWHLFFRGVVDDTPEDPADAFEDPIEDKENDVVEQIDWEYEQEGADEESREMEWARVVLTDSPGIEADTVRIESTIGGTELEFYNETEGEMSTNWAGSWGAVQLNPEGDQIVVTAVQNGTEEVVHREHYVPEEDN